MADGLDGLNRSSNVTVVKGEGDSTYPYAFGDWLKNNTEVGETERYEEYKKYVTDWREEKDAETNVKARILKDYTDFVRSVYPYVDNTETFNTDELDLNSKMSLELLIPVFAKRIKAMMMYFIDKRISLTRSKLKYSMHGSFMSIERMLHEWLLSNYTVRKNRTPSVKNAVAGVTIPKLEDVGTKVVVRVDEYYDDQNYADKNPKFGAGEYFTEIEDYVTSGNPQLSNSLYGDWTDPSGGNGILWLFEGGMNERKLDNPIYYSIRDAILGTSSLEEYEAEKAANRYVFDLTRKYLGNDYGYISGGFYKEDWRDFSYDFKTGNNYFYFPSGGYDYQPADLQINPININYTDLSANAHGADNYEDADRIFVRKNGHLNGAWLRKMHKDWTKHDMVVSVPMKLGYSFRFPLAGYGTSGDGIEWSGPIYENTHPLYMALDEAEKEVVKDAYWNNPPENYECSSMSVQRFSIADSDCADKLAGSGFLDSLHMSVRSSENDWVDKSVYSKDLDNLWLFKPEKTEWVIRDCKNYFEFPHFELRSKDDRSEFFDIKWCDDVALSSIGTASAFRGGIGGSCPANSDILYKVDDDGRVVEAAWLSATPIDCLYFTYNPDGPTSDWEYNEKWQMEQDRYKEEMNAIGWWEGLEFISKYSLLHPNQSFADWCCKTTGLFMRYEYGFKVNPGEDEYFMYTGWSPYDNRFDQGDAIGGPMVESLFLGDSPMEEFSTIPSSEGCTDYDYIYPCASYPYVNTVEDRKKVAIYYANGKWCGGISNTDVFSKLGEPAKPTIIKNVLYKYHRSSTAKTPGVFRIINEAYSQTSSCSAYDGDGNPVTSAVSWNLGPVEYTKWIKMTRDVYSGEWVSVTEGLSDEAIASAGNRYLSDMVLRSGDRLVYDSVKSTHFVCQSQYDGYDNYDFTLDVVPYVSRIGLKNARPYWAEAVNTDSDETASKSVDVHSNGIRWDSYCFLLNPLISNRVVGPLEQISIFSDIPFVWKQEVDVKEPTDEVVWCKLSASYQDVDLSSVYGNDHIVRDYFDEAAGVEDLHPKFFQSGVISAIPTNEISDIDFSYTDGDQVLINYWAVNDFTWNQRFLNVKNGIPPTGGLYVPYEMSDNGIEAIVPWANLGNRHYPSMALAPDLSMFYKKEDVGGYFVPQYLGVSEAITKSPVLEVDASRRDEVDNAIDPITVGETFAQDDGFTHGKENPAIYARMEKLDWAKVPIGIGANAGMRQDNSLAQSFIPYMTQEELRGGLYDKGLHRPSDQFDPWKGNGSYDWNAIRNGDEYQEHFTRQQPIERWANDRFVNHEITVSKQDIYGFNYVLVKPIVDNDCIYEQREKYGHVYFRGFGASYHDISEVSKVFASHPVTYCGLITDMDVAYDVFYANGILTDDPIKNIRVHSGVLDTWSDWMSNPDEWAEDRYESLIEKWNELTPFDIYRQSFDYSELAPISSASPNVHLFGPMFQVCLQRFIIDTMNSYASAYNIEEFKLVGNGCDNPYDTFNALNDNIENLYDSIRKHFISVVKSLPIEDSWLPWKIKDENGLVINNMLDNIEHAMDEHPEDITFEPHPKDRIWGMMWHLIEVCRELMKFHLFTEGVRTYIAFPITISMDGGEPTITTDVGSIITRNEPFPARFSRGWFMSDRKKYLIPVSTVTSGGILSAAVDFISLDNCGENGWSRIGADISVCEKITSEVSGSLSGQIVGDWLINPVAAYNDKTENFVILQQVSGINSEVGPIAVYNYNMIGRDIVGTSIVPYNARPEFEEYIREHSHEREEEKEPSGALSNILPVPFEDTNKVRGFLSIDDATNGTIRIMLPWEEDSIEHGYANVNSMAVSGYSCPPIDSDTVLMKQDVGPVKLGEFYRGLDVDGIYSSTNTDITDAYDFSSAVDLDSVGYIRWVRELSSINIVADENSVVAISYPALTTNEQVRLSNYENVNSVVEIPYGIDLGKRALLMEESQDFGRVKQPGSSISSIFIPFLNVAFTDGYEISGYEIRNGNEICVEDVNLSNSLDLSKYITLSAGDSISVKSKKILKGITTLNRSDRYYGNISPVVRVNPLEVSVGDKIRFASTIEKDDGEQSLRSIIKYCKNYTDDNSEWVVLCSAENLNMGSTDIFSSMELVCGAYSEHFDFCYTEPGNENKIKYHAETTRYMLDTEESGPWTYNGFIKGNEIGSFVNDFDLTNFALDASEISIVLYWDETVVGIGDNYELTW